MMTYTNNIILSHFINTMILFTYVYQNSHGILHIFDYFILIYSTMSAQKIKNTTSSYVLVIMEGVMQRYIDDGTLSRDISSLGIPTYEHISFYSWDSSLTSTLTIYWRVGHLPRQSIIFESIATLLPNSIAEMSLHHWSWIIVKKCCLLKLYLRPIYDLIPRWKRKAEGSCTQICGTRPYRFWRQWNLTVIYILIL